MTAASGGAGAAVRDLYLEFDLPLERTDELPLPSVFLTLAAHATVEHVEEDLDALRPGGLGADARAHLRRFASAVPTGCRITHVGLMLSRPGAGMRLNVDLADDVAKAALVGAVGWPGDRQAVAQISALAAPDDRVAVGFDLTDRLEPSLGLEYKPGRAERDAPARAAAIANALVAAGLCDPRKASGVARWPGFLRARTAGDAWPAELEWADALLGARAESVLLRSVSHFKLALRPGRPPEAKVYLAYRRRWLDRAEVRRALAPAIEPPSPASAASPA